MRPTTMRLVLATAVWSFVGAVPGRANADIIYNLVNDPADQNGYTLSGTITTDGTIGPIGSNNIEAWTFTISGFSTSGTFSSTDQDAFADFSPTSAVATASSIMITQYSDLTKGSDESIDLAWNPSTQSYGGSLDNVTGWFARPTSGFTGSSWTIATVASTVPEPSSIVLASLASVCGIAYRLARTGRAQFKSTTVS
jgi:hypothetical protein